MEDTNVGQVQHQKYTCYYRDGIGKTWTPIFAVRRQFQATKSHVTVSRTQFPIRHSAARTIHFVQWHYIQESHSAWCKWQTKNSQEPFPAHTLCCT